MWLDKQDLECYAKPLEKSLALNNKELLNFKVKN